MHTPLSMLSCATSRKRTDHVYQILSRQASLIHLRLALTLFLQASLDIVASKMAASDPSLHASSPNDPHSQPAAHDTPWTLDPPLHPSQLQLLPSGTVKRRTAPELNQRPATSPIQPSALPQVPGTGIDNASLQGGDWDPSTLIRGSAPTLLGTWDPAPPTPPTAATAWALLATPAEGVPSQNSDNR
jgi:hypothetical protein